jgi:hypothetical protein
MGVGTQTAHLAGVTAAVAPTVVSAPSVYSNGEQSCETTVAPYLPT